MGRAHQIKAHCDFRPRADRTERRALWRLEDFQRHALLRSRRPFPAWHCRHDQRSARALLPSSRPALGKSRPNPPLSVGWRRAENHVSIRYGGGECVGIYPAKSQPPPNRHDELASPQTFGGRCRHPHPTSATWAQLLRTGCWLLDFLRNRGESSELSHNETLRTTLLLMAEKYTSSGY